MKKYQHIQMVHYNTSQAHCDALDATLTHVSPTISRPWLTHPSPPGNWMDRVLIFSHSFLSLHENSALSVRGAWHHSTHWHSLLPPQRRSVAVS